MVVGCVRSQPLCEHDEGHRVQARRERLTVQGPWGVRQREDPPPAGGQVRGSRQQPVLAAGQHHFRRPQHPGAVPGEAGGAPLARGGKGHAVLARPPLRRRERLPDSGQRRVAGLVVGERAERRLRRRLVIHPDHAVEGDGPVGESAGLVQAHHVHPGQALHRGKLLHQDPAPGQRDRGRAEGDAGQQDQPLRHHADQRGDGRGGALARGLVGMQLADDEQHRHRRDRPRDVAQDLVDARDQLRAHQREPPRLRRQLPGVRLGAHPGRLVAARPGNHEAARQQAFAGPLVHRLGLPGEQRLIGLQAHAVAHHPVRDQLVASPKRDQIIGHKLLDSDVARRAITDHPDPRRAEHGEPVQRPLSPQLLPDADQRIGDQHDAEQRVLRLPEGQDHGQQHAQQQVEPGEDVRAQDLGDRAAGPLSARVRQPARAPLGNLGAAQPGRRRHRDRRGRRRWWRGGRVSHA